MPSFHKTDQAKQGLPNLHINLYTQLHHPPAPCSRHFEALCSTFCCQALDRRRCQKMPTLWYFKSINPSATIKNHWSTVVYPWNDSSAFPLDRNNLCFLEAPGVPRRTKCQAPRAEPWWFVHPPWAWHAPNNASAAPDCCDPATDCHGLGSELGSWIKRSSVYSIFSAKMSDPDLPIDSVQFRGCHIELQMILRSWRFDER